MKVSCRFTLLCKKAGLKDAAGVDTWKFTIKADLAILKSEIDKLDIGKLENTLLDLIRP